MKTLLWVGDAACDSGFAKCTHNTLEVLRRTYNVVVLGLNYRGFPHEYPYPIYPCWPGGDMFGVGMLLDVMDRHHPAVVVLQNDPWNIPAYMKEIDKLKSPPPIVGAIAIDSKNARGWALNKLSHVVFWTEFARQEALLGGMRADLPSSVIPLGVDRQLFKPFPRAQARCMVGLPEVPIDAFIVCNINRNQPRKRLDLTIKYFTKWVARERLDDAYLFLHVSPTGDTGVDCDQLYAYYCKRYGAPTKRMILAVPEVYHGVPEKMVARTMQAADVGLTTTLGEGWGLTTMEMMSCGIPNVLPDFSGLGEWAAPAACLVPCSSEMPVAPPVGTIGGVMDEEAAIATLSQLYHDRDLRETYRRRCLDLTQREEFTWEHIGQRWAEALQGV